MPISVLTPAVSARGRRCGDDENGAETGFHLVQNDGANTKFFGQNLDPTVADRMYHLGFRDQGRSAAEQGRRSECHRSGCFRLAHPFHAEPVHLTDSGLDRIVDAGSRPIAASRCFTNAGDINEAGAAAADDQPHHRRRDPVDRCQCRYWITAEDLRAMNAGIRGDADRWRAGRRCMAMTRMVRKQDFTSCRTTVPVPTKSLGKNSGIRWPTGPITPVSRSRATAS